MSRAWFGAALAAMATAGALVGQLLAVKPAGACSCVFPTWQLSLVSVSSSDLASDDGAGWPDRAQLTASRGFASIHAQAGEEGGILLVEAKR